MPERETCRECEFVHGPHGFLRVVLCERHAMVDRLAEALRIARDGRRVEGFGAYADELQATYDRLKEESR